jgi:ATP-binding cassette subfamily B protein
MNNTEPKTNIKKKASILSLLRPYVWPIGILVLLAVASSGLGLLFPKIIARGIDAYIRQTFVLGTFIWEFGATAAAIFIFAYGQSIIQTYTSERVARDLRARLADKISRQSYAFIEQITRAKLLTNLTSDIDSIKMFIAQAIATLVSSVIILTGASVLLLLIDVQLALAVLAIIPIIGGLFYLIFGNVRTLMKKARAVIDWLNKVINESILGSALIRVLNSEQPEYDKFFLANTEAKAIGVQILKKFAS